MEEERKSRSPWVYVGIGCLGVVVLGVAGVAASIFYIGQRAEEWGEEMKDPAMRAKRSQRLLGSGTFPTGYEPGIALSIPLIMDMVMLSDQPPDEEGNVPQPPDKLFIYVRMRIEDEINSKKFRDFVEGKTDDPASLQQFNMNMEDAEVLGRGSFELDSAKHLYVTTRGRMATRDANSQAGPNNINLDDRQGINSVVKIECPNEGTKMRMGLWFISDPAPDKPADQLDLKGTPADEEAIKRFFGHFHLCN